MKHEIDECGDECWYDDKNLLHRDDGPALLVKKEHDILVSYWYIHGQRHRIDGPAILWDDGAYCYYRNDELHRTDGPAVVWEGFKKWFINGEKIDCKDNEEFLRIVKMKELL
jgi:hypothetical protein